jgi:hypothetical protein
MSPIVISSTRYKNCHTSRQTVGFGRAEAKRGVTEKNYAQLPLHEDPPSRRRCSWALALHRGFCYLFAFPSSEVGLPVFFSEAAFPQVVDWRWGSRVWSTPWPISGRPRDLNPSSRKLQKHTIFKNFPKHFGIKGKVVGKGRLLPRDFLPEFRKLF